MTRKSLSVNRHQVESTMIALVDHYHVDRMVVSLKTESKWNYQKRYYAHTNVVKQQCCSTESYLHCFLEHDVYPVDWCIQPLNLKQPLYYIFLKLPPKNISHKPKNMTQHTNQRCIQKSKRTSLACCSMNFSIRPSLHFRRFDSEAWSTIVTYSDRAWLPFCHSRKSRHGQWVTAPAGSDSSGRAGLKNRTIHRSTKETKTICETQIILRLICETQIILKYLLSMNGCAIRRSRANAVQE